MASYIGPTGLFPCHIEHLMAWQRDGLESFWQSSGEELVFPPLRGAFSALVPFPRTAPPGGCGQHCRKEEAAATTVSMVGELGHQRPSRALQSQPSPVCETVAARVVLSPFSQSAEFPLNINSWTHTLSHWTVKQPKDSFRQVSDFLHSPWKGQAFNSLHPFYFNQGIAQYQQLN